MGLWSSRWTTLREGGGGTLWEGESAPVCWGSEGSHSPVSLETLGAAWLWFLESSSLLLCIVSSFLLPVLALCCPGQSDGEDLLQRWVRSPEQIHGVAQPSFPSSDPLCNKVEGDSASENMPRVLPEAPSSFRGLGYLGPQENEPSQEETQWSTWTPGAGFEALVLPKVSTSSPFELESAQNFASGIHQSCRMVLRGQRAEDCSQGPVRAAGEVLVWDRAQPLSPRTVSSYCKSWTGRGRGFVSSHGHLRVTGYMATC